MHIRELQKEVRELPELPKETGKFQESWIKPIRTNTNKELPGLQTISLENKKIINEKLSDAHTHILNIKDSQTIHDKLGHYAKSLIQLKLNSIRGHHMQSEMITNTMLHDEYLSFTKTISDVAHFSDTVKKLEMKYNEINKIVEDTLSLEESVQFSELPHKKHIKNLKKTANKQKELLKNLGRHFVVLARER